MICRMWKGWTSINNADKYSDLFKEKIVERVTKGISGFKGVNLLRNKGDNEVEFTTVFWFDSIEAVIQFAGNNYSQAVIPEEVDKLMIRYENVVQHHEVLL